MAYTWTNTKKPDQTVCPSFRPQIHEDYVCRRILFLPQRYFWHTPHSLSLALRWPLSTCMRQPCARLNLLHAHRSFGSLRRQTVQPDNHLKFSHTSGFAHFLAHKTTSAIRLERYRSVHERGTSDHTKHAKSLAPIDKLHDVFTRRKM